MGRRFVNTTWNNAAVVKKPKPIEPLRYRINPLDKEFDKLDALAAELERVADTLEPEDYYDLSDSLYARREKLEARRQRELGNAPVKARRAPRAPMAKARRQPRHTSTSYRGKLIGVFAVIILFAIFA